MNGILVSSSSTELDLTKKGSSYLNYILKPVIIQEFVFEDLLVSRKLSE